MASMLDDFSNVVGMVGVVFLILAYLLLSTNRISSQSLRYQLFNLTGALLILFSLFFHFNFSSFVIEVVWILISLTGIYRIMRSRQERKHIPANVHHITRRKKDCKL